MAGTPAPSARNKRASGNLPKLAYPLSLLARSGKRHVSVASIGSRPQRDREISCGGWGKRFGSAGVKTAFFSAPISRGLPTFIHTELSAERERRRSVTIRAMRNARSCAACCRRLRWSWCLRQPARADLLDKSKQVGHVTVQYKVVLPSGYDPAKAYPGIIVLGGGPQTMNTVDGSLNRNFRAEAEKRGYIVVAPAAPDGRAVLRGWRADLSGVPQDDPGRLQDPGRQVPHRGTVKWWNRRVSRGRPNPQYFVSVTAFPGYMWQPRRRSSRRSRRCASSCTSAKTTNIDGTTR